MTSETDGKVRIGIVGLGNIGTYHAEFLGEVERADIVAGLDIDADARDAFAAEFGVETYADRSDLFDQVDAVIVTTPNRFHEEYAVAALDAGVDVLLEKPLAHTLESAERIARAVRESDALCMVGFNNRFSNPVEVLKHDLRAGRFGDVTHVEANYVRRRGIPGRGSWFTSKDVAGGGALIDIGVHAIDLSLYFLDFPEVVEVSGTTRSEFGIHDEYAYLRQWGADHGAGGFDVEDSATAFIRCADGRTISLEVAWAANRADSDEFVIRGTEAGATLDRGSHDLTMYEASIGGANHFSTTDVETQEAVTHRQEQRAFVEAVQRGQVERNTVDQALAVQRVIDAIYRSAAEGRAIRLDD
ncbi:gfo/Idh/MocA family oxidoreductase [Salinigranum rubrum]|uniref:Gfo/Idh/MocA family oxidoreductase n=1 Tax=Salinigranum rubrum TaxID=755307 RepID=A0A2I8VK26_9EURY|nr:Gfo/Idh/MocA family oxidoreductase [Salinigranum rubrum]AUV82277.1 gfo/Idh/MocA family oxidoreductase [Salinigranum rubrum]